MATDYNINPYYDDFDESKQFMRILFRPGLAVQARELTQVQSIINNQQKRFADHIFEEGSQVTGGQSFYNNKVKRISIESSFGGNPVVLTEFLGKVITGGTSNAKGRVVHVNAAENGDPPMLFVEMQTGDTGTTSSSFSASENIGTVDGIAATVESTDHFSDAAIFSIQEGIFYIDGFFVYAANQTITLSKDDSVPSYRVGLTLNEETITENDDESLRDPARNAKNFQGIGAHRYKISLILDRKSLAFTEDVDNSASEKFVELKRIEEGVIKSEVKYPIYSDLGRTMARRTFDESGDYTVKPFQLRVEDHPTDDTQLRVGMEAGKAFVKGFEFETISTEYIDIPKSRETQIDENRDVNAKYGNYVIVNDMQGFFNPTAIIPVTLHSSDIPSISNQTDLDNSEIGTAYLRAVTYHTGTGSNLSYRFYIFKIVTDNSSSISNVASIWGTNYAGGVAANIDPTNGQDGGLTQLFSSSFNTALFKLPQNAVKTLKPSGSTDTEYTTQKAFTSVTFTAGVAAVNASGTNTFFGGTGALNDTIKRERYIAVCTNITNAGSTGLSDGDVIDFTSGSRSITLSGGDQVATFDIDDGSFEGDVEIIATVNLNIKPERTKTLTSTTVNTVSLSFGVGDLAISDVSRIVEIRDTGDSNAVVTEKFTLDTGQRDNFYDHGSIVLKSGESVVGDLDVDIEYFAHTGAGYFSVDSYVGVDYEDIPSYTTQISGETLELRDVLDFRPRRIDGSANFTAPASGADFPFPNSNINFDFEYYLSRFININIKSDLRFNAQLGESALRPIKPTRPQNSMTLYELEVPGFTFTKEDVDVTYVDNRRYTMRDIGSLARRLDRLEYYAALSLMEKDTNNIYLTDGSGTELFKNGILVDPFKDHSIGDFGNSLYNVSIDAEESVLRPAAAQIFKSLNFNASESTHVTKTNDGVTLPFSEANLVNQPLASKSISVNPFSVAVWQGNISMTPQTDQWVDTENAPSLVDQNGSNNSLLPVSNFTNYTRDYSKVFWANEIADTVKTERFNVVGRNAGIISNLADTTSRGIGFLYGEIMKLAKQNNALIANTTGEREIDLNFVPFIREQTIEFEVTNMKPNTTVYPFFDGIDISSFVTPLAGSLGDPLVTDENGFLGGTFELPNNENIRFRIGQRDLKFIDNAANDDESATTVAQAQFFAQGLIQNKQINVTSTRPIEAKRSDPQDNVVNSDPITRDSSNSGRKNANTVRDPVAQVFTVDNTVHPNGVMATSIELFFETKDETLPINIELRPTVNGYPHSAITVPFSQVTLNPSSVGTSSDATIGTKFTFKTPVYLEGGEYAVVVTTNSEDYKLFVAELGQNVIGTNQRIVSQPYIGSLFKSQNASIWSPELDEDMTMKIYHADFDSSTSGEAVFDVDVPAEDFQFDAFSITNDVIDPPSTTYSLGYKSRQYPSNVFDATYTNVNDKTIFDLPTRSFLNSAEADTSFRIRALMDTGLDSVSPLIDEERTNVIFIQNVINNDATDETLATGGNALARYISKKVVLRDGFDATGLKVFLNSYLPAGTSIQVYGRVLSSDDETDFDDRGWLQIPRVGDVSSISTNEEDVVELDYELLDIEYDGFTDFKSWAIKIVLLSPSTNIVPTVRDMRAIAVT